MKKIIALDADGVLLNYHEAYRQAWGRAFGILPRVVDPDAYWPIDYCDVRRLSGAELNYFRRYFDEAFWSTIPAIPGAINACFRLKNAGFNLVCVSAIEQKFCDARSENLKSLGFPIDFVIGTSNEANQGSPKAAALNELSPIAFVDDYLPYHFGVPSSIHKALIVRSPNGSPNFGDGLSCVDSTHRCLADFTEWWLQSNLGNGSTIVTGQQN